MLPSKKNQSWLPSIFNDFMGSDWIEKMHTNTPMNIIENDKEFKIEIAVPGLTKDDFSVKIVHENVLVVNVESKTEHVDKDNKGRYLRREFSYSHFQQNLILPDNVDKDFINAKVDNGILRIDIPKKTPEKIEPVEKHIKVN